MASLFATRKKIATVRPRPKACEGCIAHPKTDSWNPLRTGGYVPFSGPVDAPLLCLGITPGEDEERQGAPFVGPSGRKLRSAIAWACGGSGGRGAPEPPIRFGNLFCCRAVETGLQGRSVNRTKVTQRELRMCFERIVGPELSRTKAKVVLVLGTDAYNFLLSDLFGPFSKAMGHRLLVPKTGLNSSGVGSEFFSYGKKYSI